jgi:hypothetical protein
MRLACSTHVPVYLGDIRHIPKCLISSLGLASLEQGSPYQTKKGTGTRTFQRAEWIAAGDQLQGSLISGQAIRLPQSVSALSGLSGIDEVLVKSKIQSDYSLAAITPSRVKEIRHMYLVEAFGFLNGSSYIAWQRKLAVECSRICSTTGDQSRVTSLYGGGSTQKARLTIRSVRYIGRAFPAYQRVWVSRTQGWG